MKNLPKVIEEVAKREGIDYIYSHYVSKKGDFSFDGFNNMEAVYLVGDSQGNLINGFCTPLGERKFLFQNENAYEQLTVQEAKEKGYTYPAITKILRGLGGGLGICMDIYKERKIT